MGVRRQVVAIGPGMGDGPRKEGGKAKIRVFQRCILGLLTAPLLVPPRTASLASAYLPWVPVRNLPLGSFPAIVLEGEGLASTPAGLQWQSCCPE